MKEIPGSKNTNWENTILKDLAFIKRKGRYPINKKTLAPTLFIGFTVAFLLRFVLIAFLTHNNRYLVYFIIIVFAVSLFIAISRYMQTIRFTNIPTPFFLDENQKLLKAFMEQERLAYSRHPDAPEVFQILSRPIGGNDNHREVMVFIADDKRILVNSHFTSRKFTVAPSSRHYKSMARMLKKWIESPNIPSGQSLMTNTD